MKLLSILLLLFGTIMPGLASYQEEWLLEGEVIHHFDKKETAKLLADRRDINVIGKNFTGLKIKLTNCLLVSGHGQIKYKKGQTKVIVLGHDPKRAKEPFSKGTSLKIRSYYDDSAVPEGEPVSSHLWQLLAVLPGPEKKQKNMEKK